MRNLFFLPLFVLVTGCTNSGGVTLPNGFEMPGKAMEYTCEGIMPSAHQIYCDTGEHPNLCDC